MAIPRINLPLSYHTWALTCILVKMSIAWLKQKETIFILCLVLLLFGLHLHIIDNPSKGRTLDSQGNVVQATGFDPDYHYEGEILDEQHYVTEANSILADEGLLHPEHPSLGKLFIAAGIKIFGDNSTGWRIFPILLSMVSIILFYLICKNLTRRRDIPIIATFIFAFENMNFIQGSVAMLDVFGLPFMMASFLMFLRSRYILAGILLAVGATAKIPIAFAGIAIVLYWLIIKRKNVKNMLKFLIAAPLAFAILMPIFDWSATGELLYPWDRVDYMIDTHSTLTFAATTHGSATHPWEWITLPSADMAFWYHPTYTSAISWNLWGLIIPAILFAIYGTIKKHPLLTFGLVWIAATYLAWIPIDLIKDRVMFIFYFYPTIGALCLIVAFGISKLMQISSQRQRRKAKWAIRIPVILWGISHLVLFVMMGPMLL